MKKIVFGLLIFTQSLWAQRTIDELAIDLAKNQLDDSAKVTAIYDWITRHISYDNRFNYRFAEDTTLTQEPYNVVSRRLAVCIGYAKLFKELCRINHIESMIVEGWVKERGSFVSRQEHAWNAVRLGQNWYLVDATWDASDKTSLIPNRKFFLTPPSVFGRDHLPHDPMWQLSESPTSFECFKNGENCTSSTVFAFRDTLQNWQKLDSFAQISQQAERMFRFNPDNQWALRRLAEMHSELATQAFTSYQQLRERVVKKKERVPNAKTEALNWINRAEVELNYALNLHEKLANFRRKNAYNDNDINAVMARENLENLASERAYIEKYFKN